MKRAFAAFFLVLLFLLCACGQAPWQKQYDLGTQHLAEGNYEEAITAFDSAIEIDPYKSEAYVGRGDAYIGLGNADNNFEIALKDYEAALELDDSDQSVYLKIADIHLARDEYEQLQEILNRAKGKFGDTEEILEREKGLQTYQNYYNIGTQYLENSVYGEAISAFSTAIEFDPEQAEAYIGRGDAYIESGDADENIAAALADYEKALSLDNNNLSIYLKIADVLISSNDFEQAQSVLERAAGKLGSTEEILVREQRIRDLKDIQLVELLTSNIWDISWQTSEYLIFFPSMHGIQLEGNVAPGELHRMLEFPYAVKNNTLAIVEDEYTQEWTFDGNDGCFVRTVEEYGYTTEQYMERISPQPFFADMVGIPVDGIISASYWDDLLDLILLYKINFSTENEAATLQKEQDEWQDKLNQETDSKGIDTQTRSGIEWRNYYVRVRALELLGLPINDPNPPVYRPLLTEDEAMQIALDFWNITPGDADPDTGFKMYVKLQDTVEKQGKTYYYFMLYWMVTASYDGYYDEHPSTVDILYVDAQTGACQQDVP